MNFLNIINFTETEEGWKLDLSAFITIGRVNSCYGRFMKAFIALRSPFVIDAQIMEAGWSKPRWYSCNMIYFAGFYRTRLHGTGWKFTSYPLEINDGK